MGYRPFHHVLDGNVFFHEKAISLPWASVGISIFSGNPEILWRMNMVCMY
ncbi:hypothetical protein B4168_2387 [Anoxybacillus flavithermus]|nr:hypothetical protein B4168_2387 [Anoxybacillus flavithermus]OAO87812.1 hypothetical protein GT23_0959 [Parageobacillus thermoglucosidasius]